QGTQLSGELEIVQNGLGVFQAQNATPEWVSTIDDASCQHNASFMERLCRDVRLLFLELLENLQRPKKESQKIINSIRRSYETIVIWDDDFGASSGGLDETFQKSHEIRNLTAEILREVAETLIEGLAPLYSSSKSIDHAMVLKDLAASARFLDSHGYDCDKEAECSLGPYRKQKDIFDVTKSLSAATECLNSLAPLYEDPPMEFAPYETERQVDEKTSEFRQEQAFLDQILERLPDLNHGLARKLAQANVWRVVRCRKRQDSNGDVDHECEEYPEAEKGGKSELCKVPTNLASHWHDSGLGTSVNTGSYAATLMTLIQEDSQVRGVPRLSEGARARIPFTCWVCGHEVTIKDDKTWNCFSLTPFESYQSWENHLLAMHPNDWKLESCPFCCQTMAKMNRTAIVKHLKHHLEEIALAAMPTETNLDMDDMSQNHSDISITTDNTTVLSN
ncbi:hypothetical protein PspLS_11315, partial [Pyricularia sp. CBS 133598]